jgi:hypothetical protein
VIWVPAWTHPLTAENQFSSCGLQKDKKEKKEKKDKKEKKEKKKDEESE